VHIEHYTHTCNPFQDGLQPGTIVEVKNDSKDRWYMKILDGRVKSAEDDPYLVGAQWLKPNQKTLPELPLKSNACHIKTIIAVFDV